MPNRRSLDYVTKDYEGFRQFMIDLIPQYTPEWTDTSQSDFGIVLIELFANALDILSYYQDKNFKEAFLTTATTRKSIINLCKMLGYKLSPQTPAIHEVTFYKDDSYIDDTIVIPKGTKIGTDPTSGTQVVFELLEGDVVIPSGVSSATAVATHGITISEDILGVSNGNEFQKFKLNYPDVLPDTIEVYTIENGTSIKWQEVSDFLNSKSGDRHFVTEVNEFNETIIQFGNGLSGKIPEANISIKASYRVGGGDIGNVGIGTINSFVDKEFAGISLENTKLLVRGQDVESIERVKAVAPRFFRSTERAVTKMDFKDLALTIQDVKLASIVENKLDGVVEIYVLPTNSKELTQEQVNYITNFFNERKLIGVDIKVLSPKYRDIALQLHVKALPNFLNTDVEKSVREFVEEEFKLGNYDFGQGLILSDLMGKISMIDGVRSVSFISPLNDIEDVAENEIINLKELSVEVVGGLNE